MLSLVAATGAARSLLQQLSHTSLREVIIRAATTSALEPGQASSSQPSLPSLHTHALRPPYAPWTPTMDLVKRRRLSHRMRHLLHTLEHERLAEAQRSRQFPPFSASDILEVRVMAAENGRQEYVFRGVCVERKNKGIRTAFKIFNVFPEVGGVMQHFPLYMPDLLEVRVVGRIKEFGAKRNIRRQVLQLAETPAGARKFRFQEEVKPLTSSAAPSDLAPSAPSGGKPGPPAAAAAATKESSGSGKK